MIQLILSLVGSLNVSHAQLQRFPSDVFKFEIVEFQPEKGYHFELAANQGCSNAQVIQKSKELIKCQMLEVGESKVQLNICDDKKTFCKPHDFVLTVKMPPEGFKRPPLQKGLTEMKEKIHQELLPGFENLTLEKAIAKAKEHSKPVLILISTDWCPPCNQSKEYLLSTKEFQDFTKDWLKVYVDGDSADSVAYDEQVSFFEYPTFVLANSDFAEVSRFREEFSFTEFKKWWERSKPYMSIGYEAVKQRVLARKDQDWVQKVRDVFFFRSEEEQKKDVHFVIETAVAKNDLEFLKKTQIEDVPSFLQAEWLSDLHDELVPQKLSEEEFNLQALESSGLKPSFVYYLKEICHSKHSQCEVTKKELSQRPQQILNRKDRTQAENLAALADEHYAQMGFFKDFKQKAKSVAQAKLCVNTFEKLMKFSDLKLPRYAMQGILACSKEFDLGRAEKVYLDLISKYPDDPTFILPYARFLKNEMKNLRQANVWVNKALDKSYDFNWFYAASLKVQIAEALGQYQNAKSTINEAYARLKLDLNEESRNQKVLARFRELEQNLMMAK